MNRFFNFIVVLCIVQGASAFAEPKEPKSSVGHRGYGSSRPCPWNCKLAGLPANKCRDWKTGSTCYIEDFTRAPRSSNDVAAQAEVTQNQIPAGDLQAAPAAVSAVSTAEYQECRKMLSESANSMGQPAVEVGDTKKSGGVFSDKYSVRGTVEGVCLVEAGVFRGGKKIQDIPVQTTREFRRFEFDVKANSGDEAEIRAYNINGQRDVYLFTGPR